MRTTSTTPNLKFSKLSLMIVLLFSFQFSFAHPTTYASIGDFVWVDTNSNGIQDSGEPGLANVTVKLLNASGAVVATTTTNSSGKYSFTNVYVPSCANFRVQFGTPGQYTWTKKQAPGSTVYNNSNADVNGLSDAFSVCAGDNNVCLDAGIIQSASGKASIGDFVWVDVNANGIQDSGEPGVSGVVVKLLNSAGTTVATTTTNSSGLYLFSNISISACGMYRVQFGTPGQYVWTTKQAPGSTVTNNSNADVNGLTDEFSVCPGDYNTCIDAGMRQLAKIGDFVWDDNKVNNGRQDAGEPGVANVTVQLLNSAGTVIATTTTNASGNYQFTISISSCGQYKVKFTVPGNPSFVPKHQTGSTANNDNDANTSGITDLFTVCPGDNNLTIDAGICSQCGPLPIKLDAFQGTYTNGSAKLFWSASTETAQTSYNIERSADGLNFTSIDVVRSKGGTANSYNFNDNVPLSGNNYYRLKIADGNGNLEYSKIILLNVAIKGINIKLISANPFSNQVKVNVVTENSATIKLILTDHAGRILKTQMIQGQKGSNQISIDQLGSLAKGIYNLELSAGGQTTSIKLMKD